MGSLSGSGSSSSSEVSSDGSMSDEESSSDEAAEEEDVGEEGLQDVGAVATPEAIIVGEPRLATPCPVLAVVPPSPSKVSTERDDAIPPASNRHTGLPAQSPVSV